jgi:hypothetical protein
MQAIKLLLRKKESHIMKFGSSNTFLLYFFIRTSPRWVRGFHRQENQFSGVDRKWTKVYPYWRIWYMGQEKIHRKLIKPDPPFFRYLPGYFVAGIYVYTDLQPSSEKISFRFY